MTELDKKELKKLEIKLTEHGFTIWVEEIKKIDGKKIKIKHWIIDGSMMKIDGTISLGYRSFDKTDDWKVGAFYDERHNDILICKK